MELLLIFKYFISYFSSQISRVSTHLYGYFLASAFHIFSLFTLPFSNGCSRQIQTWHQGVKYHLRNNG